ncbi:hypothetical protein FRB95_004903 [Tulasnella sp. JGI-2019a]|nr:hypothetical protein FRB93_012836 [Tulasnella sp. JGI-2019a]KAG9029806.1 hypothetical protein FRB95_004903 [Tulasnella sp. JGI-2019a]
MPNDVAHPVLHVTELILQFTSYLHNSIKTKDIDSASMVCKSWYEPVMDIKWKTAFLRPLLSTLAPLRISQDGEWEFDSPLTRDDWTRFHKVARRVSILERAELWRFTDALLEVLRMGSHSISGLVPNLQRLEIIDTDPEAILGILGIFPSTLDQLIISTLGTSQTLEQTQLLQSISFRFTQLSRFDIQGFGDTEECHNALATMLSQLKDLRSVNLHGQSPSTEVISVAARLPSLRILKIRGLSITEGDGLEWKPSVGVFPKLLQLDLQSNLDKFTALLIADIAVGEDSERYRQNHSLNELFLDHRKHITLAPAFPEVIRAISLHFSLRQLRLDAVKVETLVIAALEPLKACTALQSLKLDIQALTLEVTDGEVDKLLDHLPSLEILYLTLSAWGIESSCLIQRSRP